MSDVVQQFLKLSAQLQNRRDQLAEELAELDSILSSMGGSQTKGKRGRPPGRRGRPRKIDVGAVSAPKRRGRPPKNSKGVDAPAKTRKRRKLSPAALEAIREGQRKRWAARKAQA